jgi:hypothetical protein
MRPASRVARALVGALATAALLAVAPGSASAGRQGVEPVLSHVELTEPKIHAVGAEHTGVPKRTKLKLTLNVPAMVRVRVRDLDPYGLRRAFNQDVPAGESAITITARVDGTKLPPGKYEVVVKAHNPDGSSQKLRLHLRIVGEK